MKLKVFGAALAALVLGATLTGAVPASGAQAPQPRVAAALAADNTVDSSTVVNESLTGADIKNGTLYQADLNPALVDYFTGVFNNTVGSAAVKDGSLLLADFSQAAKDGLKGDKGDTGATGPQGPAGAGLLTVTADSMVTARPDTATDGSVWANDSMTRTLSVTKQHAAEATKCGAGAVKCFFYTGTIKDNGTFTTVTGAHGPNSATAINGIVNGTLNGVYEIEFYANSDAPNPSLVDSTVTGASPSTSNWMKLAFPAGTLFAGFAGVDYKWVYLAPATCETHTQTTTSTTGDILGINHCS